MAFSTEATSLPDHRNPEPMRREMIIFKDIPYKHRNDVPLDEIHVINGFNHRKTFAADELMELGKSIESQVLLSAIQLIKIDVETKYLGSVLKPGFYLFAGEKRLRAMREYTSLEICPKADVYHQSALPWIMTLSLIENEVRGKPPIQDKIAGMKATIELEYNSFDDPRKEFLNRSGLNPTECTQLFKIGDAMEKDKAFEKIVDSQIIKSIKVLYNFAQAINVGKMHKTKRDTIDKAFNLLLDGNLAVGDVTEFSTKIKNYAKGQGNKPSVKSKKEASESASQPKAQKEEGAKEPKVILKKPLSTKRVMQVIQSIDNSDTTNISTETKEALVALSKKIELLIA